MLRGHGSQPCLDWRSQSPNILQLEHFQEHQYVPASEAVDSHHENESEGVFDHPQTEDSHPLILTCELDDQAEDHENVNVAQDHRHHHHQVHHQEMVTVHLYVLNL